MRLLSAVCTTFLACAPCALSTPVSYFANLDGPSENPANASPGTGIAFVTIDTTAHTLDVSASFSDLLGPTTAAHIHCCTAPPGNIGVATTTPTFTGFPTGVTSGVYSMLFDTTLASTWNASFITANGGTPLGAEAALEAGLAAGTAYFNIHTSLFPGGEIRGFLEPVPEPATLYLLPAGLAAVLLFRRRLVRH